MTAIKCRKWIFRSISRNDGSRTQGSHVVVDVRLTFGQWSDGGFFGHCPIV